MCFVQNILISLIFSFRVYCGQLRRWKSHSRIRYNARRELELLLFHLPCINGKIDKRRVCTCVYIYIFAANHFAMYKRVCTVYHNYVMIFVSKCLLKKRGLFKDSEVIVEIWSIAIVSHDTNFVLVFFFFSFLCIL